MRISYPSSSEDRVWAGNVSSSGFTVSADLPGPVELIRLNVSLNSDMSAPVFHSDWRGVLVTTGSIRTYRSVMIDAVGLQPNTLYYYQFEHSSVPSSGSLIRSLTTAPADAVAFRLAFGSCSDICPATAEGIGRTSEVFRTIAALAPRALFLIGDNPYMDTLLTAPFQRDHWRKMRQSPDLAAMLAAVPADWTLSDHDYASNDCSLDTTNAAAIFANTQAVYAECIPHYPLPLAPLLAHTATYGLIRLIFPDMYGASSYLGNTCLGEAQLAWLQDEVDRAADDGMAWIFLICARTWTGAVNNGFGDRFTDEAVAISNMAKASVVPVCLVTGDVHATAFDDGANTDKSDNDGTQIFCQLVASGLYQAPSGSSGPYTWGGVAKHFHTSHQQFLTVDFSADNASWTATSWGEPIDGAFAATNQGSVSSADL